MMSEWVPGGPLGGVMEVEVKFTAGATPATQAFTNSQA